MTQSYLLIAVDPESRFAIRFLDLSPIIAESLNLHKITAALTKPYAEFLVTTTLLGSRADEQETSLFKLKLTNAAFTLNSEISPRGPLRSALFPPENQSRFDGDLTGTIETTRLMPDGKTYRSVVNAAESITKTFRHHLAQSTQTESILQIIVTEENKGYGLWIEKLPDTTIAEWNVFATRFANDNILADAVSNTTDPDKIINTLFPETINILAVTKPRLECSCSHERFLSALSNLSPEELVELFMDGQGVTSQCDYCHREWTVTDQDLQVLLKTNGSVH